MSRPHSLQSSARMSRRSADYDYAFPFHVGARCINREWFAMPMDQVWMIMQRHLYFMVHAFDTKIFAFLLMSNHFHLLMSAPHGNLSQAMAFFLRETSREITFSADRINHTYSGRFFRSSLVNPHYYLQCYKYLYRNPIAAGFPYRVEEYRYSTLRGLLGLDQLIIPVKSDITLFSDVEGTLRWLNRAPNPEHWKTVGNALRKKHFMLPKHTSSKRDHELETALL